MTTERNTWFWFLIAALLAGWAAAGADKPKQQARKDTKVEAIKPAEAPKPMPGPPVAAAPINPGDFAPPLVDILRLARAREALNTAVANYGRYQVQANAIQAQQPRVMADLEKASREVARIETDMLTKAGRSVNDWRVEVDGEKAELVPRSKPADQKQQQEVKK